jgi:site-specific DNA recombinase
VASLDRLSRNLRFAENLFFAFERLQVTVCIVDMPHYEGNDQQAVMLRQIHEVVAEHTRKDIITRLKKGREARARNGHLSGGNLAYGVARRNGRIEIDAEEAAIVRRIFALDTNGHSKQYIADLLNEHGDRQRNGKPWTGRQVGKILDRRAFYTEGIVKYGSVTGKNPGLILCR